ncbi:phosphonate ABC transporter, permease protein PhnE [Rhizobium lentis]|uniref:phosphonate ABC transporter, permease protein PhnE n=1 Tax=Rhizobium lentis TaxID=1138194 RepID=UPI001A92E31E|nr:phosphonate ABC transporter, permease protein PhnE [Rhizobium lentis]MBX4998555.1 phosphonate ABC transporter, permease protein PhnE [Rhizobium lentis]MBX5017001.1 phosphonate ABC transporter, permease protein PhnE [Rhizobium lentis]MBX5040709.1 phosphonate ABC transporter, permease protein PhnE [Rhizobium lentis]MBX5053699.1 phosphonate ABC transporter, permease protein PhnE [Rhizobium lentis]MBX5066014.1 phosphonate ABC transporter, permease protein PhnE [Rhizobium lentis]
MSSVLTIDAAKRNRLLDTYPDVFHRSFMQRWGFPLISAAVLVYLAFCFAFFNVIPTFMNGNWDRAATYVQDWYSWRAQPRLRFQNDQVVAQWTSRRQYPEGADIDWLKPSADGSRYIVTFGSDGDRLEVGPSRVDVYVDGKLYPVTITRDRASLPANAPAQMQQDDNKVNVYYGFAGQAEIRTSQVYVQRRFLGWANFFFDTQSPFWGRSLPEIIGLIFSGDRLDANQSNASLALDNFLNNTSWQHGDILSKLMQTLVMAFVGTLFGTLVAFPLAFIAARNIMRNRTVNWGTKRLFDFLRSIDMLIWALFFTRAFGPGPLPGIAAIFFTDTGALGKVYAEALENIDDKQREGVKSVGAAPVAVQRFGVIPQVLPVFISQSLYFWESNTRSATVIGAVGAGGIGLKLLESMKTNSDWDKVAYMVLLILLVVFAFDNLSNALRSRVMGKKSH